MFVFDLYEVGLLVPSVGIDDVCLVTLSVNLQKVDLYLIRDVHVHKLVQGDAINLYRLSKEFLITRERREAGAFMIGRNRVTYASCPTFPGLHNHGHLPTGIGYRKLKNFHRLVSKYPF